MSDKRIAFYCRLPVDTKEKIKIIATDESRTQSDTIAFIVDKYFKDREKEHILLVETIHNVMEEVLAPIKNNLNKVRLINNVIDRENKMMVEFWNHYFLFNDFKELGTTEKHKTIEVREAEELIQNRIISQRNKRLEKQKTSSL